MNGAALDENMSITVSLTIHEAIGIIGDLHHMIRLNRAASREEDAAWGRARGATMHKLVRSLRGGRAGKAPDCQMAGIAESSPAVSGGQDGTRGQFGDRITS